MADGFPPKEVTLLLRAEGAAVLAASGAAYWQTGASWWLFALLFLAPDMSFLGYAVSRHSGAVIYNLAHWYVWPAAMVLVAQLAGAAMLMPFALIWAAHIGFDRMMGYGMKFPGTFNETHLGRIGKGMG